MTSATSGEIVPEFSPTPPSIFTREPALLLGIVSGVVAVVSSSVFPLTVDQQGAVNAVAAGVLGLIVAFVVRGGTWGAALIAVVKAGIALLLAFKFALSPDLQSGIMFLVEAVVSYGTRAIVSAAPPALPGTSAVA
jgi:hypothetical protein